MIVRPWPPDRALSGFLPARPAATRHYRAIIATNEAVNISKDLFLNEPYSKFDLIFADAAMIAVPVSYPLHRVPVSSRTRVFQLSIQSNIAGVYPVRFMSRVAPILTCRLRIALSEMTRKHFVGFCRMKRKRFAPVQRAIIFIAAFIIFHQGTTQNAKAQIYSPFEGGYIGGLLGALFSDSDFTINGADDDAGSDSGFGGGIMGGYNFSLHPQVILGIESNFIFTNLGNNPSLADHEFSVVGRAGYLFRPNLLGFLVVGATGANFSAKVTQTTTTMNVEIRNAVVTLKEYYDYGEPTLPVTTTRESKVSKRLWGFTVGGGIDFFLSRNIIAGIDYRFTNFESWNFEALGLQFNVNENVHEARFRLSVPLSTIFGDREPL